MKELKLSSSSLKKRLTRSLNIQNENNYKFPRLTQEKHKAKHQSFMLNTNNIKIQNEDTENILINKNLVFDYKTQNKDLSKINRKNIEFFNNKQEKAQPPKKLVMMKTFDEENKHQLSKSMPRNDENTLNNSKHKRQVTQFKFEQDGNSCDQVELKTCSSVGRSSRSSRIENINSKKNSNDETKLYKGDCQKQRKQISQIKFQKAKQKLSGQSTNNTIKPNIINSGGACTSINSFCLVVNNENSHAQSVITSKQASVKRKSKQNKSMNKSSDRSGRGASNSKKIRNDNNQTFDMSNIQNSNNIMGNQNKNQNVTINQIVSNKASRYNQLIGMCNPNILYQTQQCCSTNNKSSIHASPKESKDQVLNNLIKKDAIDTSAVFKLNPGQFGSLSKRPEKKRKQLSKNSNSKSKNPSITRSSIKHVNKISSPYSKIKISKDKFNNKVSSANQTARDLARTSRKEKQNGKSDMKKSCLSSSKICGWGDGAIQGANSDVNSNMYRDSKNISGDQNQYKRNKSSRSNNSNNKKNKKKLYTSMVHTVDKRVNLEPSNQNVLANHLISLIQKIHSPKSNK